MGILQQMNGWIFQKTPEMGSGDYALNSSRFLSGFDRAPVYRRLSEIPPSELDEIFQGCCRLDSTTRYYDSIMSKENRFNSESRLRLPCLIEIGVDVDEGPRPNMTIGDGARSSVEPR